MLVVVGGEVGGELGEQPHRGVVFAAVSDQVHHQGVTLGAGGESVRLVEEQGGGQGGMAEQHPPGEGGDQVEDRLAEGLLGVLVARGAVRSGEAEAGDVEAHVVAVQVDGRSRVAEHSRP